MGRVQPVLSIASWAAAQVLQSRRRDQPWAVPLRRTPVVRDRFGVARWQKA